MAEGTPSPLTAHEETYEAVHRLRGLGAALFMAAQSHRGLTDDSPETSAIWELIHCIEERAKAAEEASEREWDAVRAQLFARAA